ncbi:MAG: hypothetical protein K9M07_01775 [Simkaniaceae bacterium]|nr:hypothetical protein [Simkaniaceae bacterium]
MVSSHLATLDPSTAKSHIDPAQKATDSQLADVVKGDPFELFFYYVTVVMQQDQTQSQSQNIYNLSDQLSQMTGYLNDWNSVKSSFYASASSVNDDQTPEFRGGLGKVLNELFQPYMNYIGVPSFPEDGSISADTYQNYTKLSNYIENAPDSELNQTVLGTAVRGIMQNTDQLAVFLNPSKTPLSLNLFWQSCMSGNADNLNLPNPILLQPFVNALSEGAGTLGGISSTESSKLQYSQNQFNRLQSFIKDMLNDWVTQRHNFNSAMGQANS